MVDWKRLLSPKPSLDVPGLETVDLSNKEMEKRIVWKQDIRILPWICVTYLLSTCIGPLDDTLMTSSLLGRKEKIFVLLTIARRLSGSRQSWQRTNTQQRHTRG